MVLIFPTNLKPLARLVTGRLDKDSRTGLVTKETGVQLVNKAIN
jgi:hypothetical protein